MVTRRSCACEDTTRLCTSCSIADHHVSTGVLKPKLTVVVIHGEGSARGGGGGGGDGDGALWRGEGRGGREGGRERERGERGERGREREGGRERERELRRDIINFCCVKFTKGRRGEYCNLINSPSHS